MSAPASTPPDMDRRERRFLLGLALVLAVAAYLVVKPYAGWVLFALFTAYLLARPRHALLARGWPRWAVASLLTVVTTLVVIAPFGVIAWQLSDELGGLASALEGRDPDFFLARVMDEVGVPDDVRERALTAAEGIIAAAAARAVAIVGNMLIGSVLAVFILLGALADGDRLVAWMRRHVPLSAGRRETLFAEARRYLDAIAFGVLAVAVVQGLAAGVGWWLFGMPEPLFWGFVLVIASLVPYVGPYVVLVPAIVWLFAEGQVARAVGLGLYAVFVVGLVDNVVRPYLIGRRAAIHPAIVLVGAIGGVPAFGPMGIVLGPLVLAMLFAVLSVIRSPDEAERVGRARVEERALGNAARVLDEADRAKSDHGERTV